MVMNGFNTNKDDDRFPELGKREVRNLLVQGLGSRMVAMHVFCNTGYLEDLRM